MTTNGKIYNNLFELFEQHTKRINALYMFNNVIGFVMTTKFPDEYFEENVQELVNSFEELITQTYILGGKHVAWDGVLYNVKHIEGALTGHTYTLRLDVM